MSATMTRTNLKTPLELMYKWEKELPNKPYLHQPLKGEWYNWTWSEFGDQVRRMAAAIEAKDLEPRSKIGILSKNCAHWLMSDLAIMMSGHISVPIYPNVNEANKDAGEVSMRNSVFPIFIGQ